MRFALTILILCSATICCAQDSLGSNIPIKIEFRNGLDKLEKENSFRFVNSILQQPDSIDYSWINYSFGGPRIVTHTWESYYSRVNCTIKFKKHTGKRIIRPAKSSAKLSVVTVNNGVIYLNDNQVLVGITPKEEMVSFFTNIETSIDDDSIELVVSNKHYNFIFNS